MLKNFKPPFRPLEKTSYIENKIKNFSSSLFKNKLYGYLTAIYYNFYFICSIIYKRNISSLIIEIVISYVIQSILFAKFSDTKKM